MKQRGYENTDFFVGEFFAFLDHQIIRHFARFARLHCRYHEC